MLKEIAECTKRGESFAIETTLSGLMYLRYVREWKRSGYHISLFFLTLPSVEAAIERVAERVRHGGNDIPDEVIRRRFTAGRHNFEQYYQNLVDAWALFDNAGAIPLMLAWGENK